MPATQYHVWADLQPGIRDLDFARSVHDYLERLKQEGVLLEWRLSRRKLGLGLPDLGEFHIVMEFADLAALDRAFESVSGRTDPVESFHHAVNAKVRNFRAALYRDFPDPHRVAGQERF